MTIFNISFVIPATRKDSFMKWASSEAKVAAATPSLRGIATVAVIAVPGDPEFANGKDRTISLQMRFDSIADCRHWHETRFEPVMESYARWHGPQPLFFATILKESELKESGRKEAE